ncbi:GTP-binding protein 2 [Smittium mucronatum]|uniref:GTP-binding protein 2 n=1 Tax=Smittium mucronatum TaxID=133383 RepID=A0A1R0H3C4_9FUNG|nr:GTP-binding protein 2 [Smittium mucronatum]
MTSKELFFSEEKIIDSKSRGTISDTSLKVLPPELDNCGNVEYKYKLINVSQKKIQHLSTQLLWRLSQGKGYAIYQLGVLDDGTLKGISKAEMNQTLATLDKASKILKDTFILNARWRQISHGSSNNFSNGSKDKYSLDHYSNGKSSNKAELFLKEPPNSSDIDKLYVCEVTFVSNNSSDSSNDIRFLLLGDHKAGKSTLLGCLAHKIKDNGKGRARLGILRHQHELISGASSSISQEVIKIPDPGQDSSACISDFDFLNGISTDNPPNDFENTKNKDKVTKHIAFVDTCGLTKHLKTTIRGAVGKSPDYIIIVLGADLCKLDISVYRYITLSRVLGAPIMFVITKMDLARKDSISRFIHSLVDLIEKAIPNYGQQVINTTSKNLDPAYLSELSAAYMKKKLVPIFLCSCMQPNMAVLSRFIGSLKPRVSNNGVDSYTGDKLLLGRFEVEKIFKTSTNGIVLLGLVKHGSLSIDFGNSDSRIQSSVYKDGTNGYEDSINESSELTSLLGPDRFGLFKKVQISSILHHREPVTQANKGNLVSIEILIDGDKYFQKDALIRPGSNLLQFKSSIVELKDNFSTVNASSPRLGNGETPFNRQPIKGNASTIGKTLYYNTQPKFSNYGSNSEHLYSLKRSEFGDLGDVCVEFMANVVLIEFSNCQEMGSVGTIYCGSIRQQARVSGLHFLGNKYKFGSFKKEKRKLSKINRLNSPPKFQNFQGNNSVDAEQKNCVPNVGFFDEIWDKLDNLINKSTVYVTQRNLDSGTNKPKPDPELGSIIVNKPLSSGLEGISASELKSALPKVIQDIDSNSSEFKIHKEISNDFMENRIHTLNGFDYSKPKPDLKRGDIVTVKIQLLVRKEYIQIGYPILFMQGSSIVFAGYISNVFN